LSFLVAIRDGQAIAARLSAAFGSGASLLHVASRAEHRRPGAGELLARDQLRWAHDRRCVRFDMRRVQDRADEILRGQVPAHVAGARTRHARRVLGRFGAQHVGYVPTHAFAYTESRRWLLECVEPEPGSADRLASLSQRLDPRT
jgi:hypothetical protein